MDNKPHAYYNFWPLHIPPHTHPHLNPPNLGLPSIDSLRNLKATPTQHFFWTVIVCIPRPFSSKRKALLLIEDILAPKFLCIQGDIRKKVGGSPTQNQTKCLLTRLFRVFKREDQFDISCFMYHELVLLSWKTQKLDFVNHWIPGKSTVSTPSRLAFLLSKHLDLDARITKVEDPATSPYEEKFHMYLSFSGSPLHLWAAVLDKSHWHPNKY